MANVSEPSGTFRLIGDWTPEMIRNLNIIKKEWGGYFYNTEIEDDFEEAGTGLAFWGQGRWAYMYNLSGLGEATELSDKDEVRKAYRALSQDMENHKARIQVEYVDRERGCEVLYEATAELFGQCGKIACEETKYIEHEYSDENLDRLGYQTYDEEGEWGDGEDECAV